MANDEVKQDATAPAPKRSTKARPASKPTDQVETPAVNIVSAPAAITAHNSWSDRLGRLNRKAIWRSVLAVVVLVLIVLGVFGVLIYHYKSENPVVRAVAMVVPYPVESVNGQWVSYHDYLFELGTVKQYYSTQKDSSGKPVIDFNTADGRSKLAQLKKEIMDQLKSDTVTRQLIAKNKIKVTSKQVSDEVNQLAQQAGGTDKLKGVLTKDYGWSLNDLKGKLKFQLGEQQLSDKITSDPAAMAQAKAKAQDVLNQINAGGDFGTLAKKYSQDSSASNGGDIGTFAKGSGLDTNLEKAAFALQPGQVSGVVKVAGGYSIIKVIDKPTNQVHAAEIFIKSVDFNQYLAGKVKAAKVSTYLKV